MNCLVVCFEVMPLSKLTKTLNQTDNDATQIATENSSKAERSDKTNRKIAILSKHNTSNS